MGLGVRRRSWTLGPCHFGGRGGSAQGSAAPEVRREGWTIAQLGADLLPARALFGNIVPFPGMFSFTIFAVLFVAAPKSQQRGSGGALEEPKTASAAAKALPRRAQEGPKTAPDLPMLRKGRQRTRYVARPSLAPIRAQKAPRGRREAAERSSRDLEECSQSAPPGPRRAARGHNRLPWAQEAPRGHNRLPWAFGAARDPPRGDPHPEQVFAVPVFAAWRETSTCCCTVTEEWMSAGSCTRETVGQLA